MWGVPAEANYIHDGTTLQPIHVMPGPHIIKNRMCDILITSRSKLSIYKGFGEIFESIKIYKIEISVELRACT